jgi:Uncharacterized protein conserved in archaea
MPDADTILRAELHAVFDAASYPVGSTLDLLKVLPDGPMTRFTVGDDQMTAMELATVLSPHQAFPYADADALISAIVDGLREEGRL